jgi:hypothetical protein
MRRFATFVLRLALLLAAASSPLAANVYTVTHTGDTGSGSLRWAILQANSHAGADEVAFDVPGAGVKTISPQTPLPSLAAGTSIRGGTQHGYTGAPLIRIDGGNLAANVWGIDTQGGNLAIEALQIVRFNGPGVRIWHDGITLRSNWIGTDGSAGLGNAGSGISCHAGVGLVVGGAGVTDGNVISGNGGNGISLDASCGSATISRNRIGTNASGTAAIPNAAGIYIESDGAQIGSSSASDGNLLSGNQWEGIVVGEQSSGATILGNRIGTNATGTAALPNQGTGIAVRGDGVAIGSTSNGAGNLISGNGSHGILFYPTSSGAVVRANRIGVDSAGTGALGNGGDGIALHASGHEIGGASASARNLISGNASSGIAFGEASSGNLVRGNWIGTDAGGAAVIANQADGIRLRGTSHQIGGTVAAARNVISGNAGNGVTLDEAASGNFVRGNFIGTDSSGAGDLGNGAEGIGLHGSNNLVGGTTAAERNLISGNGGDGIGLYGPGVSGNQILNNRIGTNAAGTAAIPNEGYGIRAIEGEGNSILLNLISGNERAMSLEDGTVDFLVQGNVIGLNAAQTAKLPNHSTGLDISGVGHLIGGSAAGAGNVIAGNDYSGILLTGAATENRIEGNFIGTNAAGATGLGNAQVGVMVTEASNNTIGGIEPGAGNTIAWNGYLGVYVWSGSGNAILGNSIHDNVLLGIELDPQGPEPNDAGDWDAGANRGQNYPVLTSALASGGQLAIQGFLDARPWTEYRVELFSSVGFDATGVGEGQHYLGAVVVTTPASGRGTFSVALPAVGGELFVTATATSPGLDTSEFSPAIAIGAPQPGRLQIWRDLLLSYEGTPGVEISIVRSHGVAGTVTVDVEAVAQSAEMPADFGELDTTLTFAPGEVVKQVFVPIVTDAEAEGDETWRLVLDAPTGGASLGANQNVLAWLFDATPAWPMYSIGDASLLEGNDGSKSLTFTVTLTATDHDVDIEWWTSAGTALPGEDYVESTGVLHFAPGQGSKTLSVPVTGDADPESDEVFYVHLYGLAQSIVWDGLGEARILDDDGGGDQLLFADDFESAGVEAWSSIAGLP